MARDRGGFGIGTIMFITWITYLIIGDDGDKKKNTEKLKEESTTVEKVKEHATNIKEETKQIIKEAKKSFDETVKKSQNKQIVAEAKKEETKQEKIEKEKVKPLEVKQEKMLLKKL